MRSVYSGMAIVAAVVSALGVTNANASTVYTYTGNDFTSLIYSPPWTTSDYVTISLTFSAPLGADHSVDTFLTPTSWSISAGNYTITNTNDLSSPNGFQTPFFQIETDGTGNIIHWRIGDILASNLYYITSANYLYGTLGCGDPAGCIGEDASTYDGGDVPRAVNSFDAGTWSATPLPAALPLFASGLGALGLLGWRRKKKAAALAA